MADTPFSPEAQQTDTNLSSQVAPTDALPSTHEPIIGRERELEQLVAMLHRPEVRLLTLTGTGGTGKTRLALELLSRLRNDYPDGATFVGLAPVTHPDQVPIAIAQALGIHETASTPVADLLPVALATSDFLLLLDNFEHVLDAAPTVARLLDACPRLTILATSRAPLRVEYEHELRVAPLTLPDPVANGDMRELANNPAIRLFVTQTQKIDPGFVLTPANAEAVAMICHRLDGLPLAIKLAAGRSRVLDSAAVLARLEQRLPLLATDQRDAPARQRTMRDAIAWSYDLLQPHEQTLFRQLGVFHGGFSLVIAESMIQKLTDRQSPEATSPDNMVLDTLESLIDQHLIERKQLANGDIRFTILETVREYALERLVATAEHEDVRTAHAYACLEWAEHANPQMFMAEQELWLARSEREQPNIRAVLDWVLAHSDSSSALRLAWANGPVWLRQARHREALFWLSRVFALPDPAPSEAVIFCHLIACAATYHLGQQATSREHVRAALAMAQEIGHLGAEGIARTVMAQDLIDTDLDAAERMIDEAIELLKAHPMMTHVAPSLQVRAVIAGRREDNERFAQLTKESYEYALDIGDWFQVVDALLLRAEAAWRYQAFDEALGYLEQAIEYAPQASAHLLLILVIRDAALLAHARGDHRHAVRWAMAGRMDDASIGQFPDRDYAAHLIEIVTDATEAIGTTATQTEEDAARQLTLTDAANEVHAYRLTLQKNSGAPLSLTSREAEVLRLVAAGRTDAQIAESLFIARATASRHVSNILSKLDVSSRTAAVDTAYRLGLLD